jgi:putative glutamine transport system substrate-binding protein
MRRSIALLLGLALLLTACGGLGGSDPVAAIKSKGKLTCGVKFDVVGFGFKNPQTNEIEGLDADLCREIANKIGVTAELVEAVSAKRIPFLKEDKLDLIISTFTVNEERKKEVDFSHTYYVTGQAILVKQDSSITKVEDLVGKKVCSGEGSTSEKNLRDKGVAQTDLLLFKTYTEGAAALVDGRCEAVSTDAAILFGLAQQNEGLKVLPGTFTQEPLGIGIKKGKTALVTLVNTTLEEMKADGRLKALYDKHIKPFTGEDVTPPF